MPASRKVYIGTAAWSVPKIAAEDFPPEGSHLQRYSKVLNAVEINSSFYRHHQEKSYIRWAEETPDHFRFSVKLFQGVTHDQELQVSKQELAEILKPIQALKRKWRVLLVQLPKSVEFNLKVLPKFLENLRNLYSGKVVFEARNPSWALPTVKRLYEKFEVSAVIADPMMLPELEPEVSQLGKIVYFRLHGSPEIYKSNYEDARLLNYTTQIARFSKQVETWCIFDNTTFGYATVNAVNLMKRF